MKAWSDCKNIVCIRADNMGDLLMSSPAIRALKHFTEGKVTVLTSSKATALAALIPEIDAVITYNFPWIKLKEQQYASSFLTLIKQLKERHFDACVVFTVYSQNPLPAVLLAYLAEIPLRLAYCRENPYELLTDWIPDPEPLQYIRHQVERDLDLVAEIGANSMNNKLSIRIRDDAKKTANEKLKTSGVSTEHPYIILHSGVSETKRMYSEELWIKCGVELKKIFGLQIVLTGIEEEKELTSRIEQGIGKNAFSVAGIFTLEEFVSVIDKAVLVLSVNTGTIHLAAATETPLVVLYAQTNPQHTPWKVSHKLLEFSIAEEVKSKNEIIRYVDGKCYQQHKPEPTVNEIVEAVSSLLSSTITRSPAPE